ncbi:MAG TPA: S41 family peptidase [Candidatus Paceibacterota bacterium]|jgi:carboxyl-terminal processing protease|nr:S41 family peptidase [Candidatus Paceibacterota bacterium]
MAKWFRLSKKATEIVLVVVASVALIGSGFWLGWTAGRKIPENITVTGISNIQTPSSTTADFSTFWQAWQLINDNYLNASTTDQEKVYGAINGLVNSLGDPYSEFFDPSDNQEFQQDITGNFGGIGAELGTDTNGNIVIISALKGTPAAAAGLKAEDEVVGVNGSSTESMTVDQVVDLIRGAAGTPVTLGILRSGWSAPKDFKITRENITVPDVTFAMKGNVAVITLEEFTQDSDQDFYNALAQALNANAKGIVLDLRGDPGGYLEVAVDIAGYFLKPGSLIVKEVGRTVPEQDYTATGSGALDTMPMAILIDNGSASAAEILSGALHDDRTIPLVGEHSFGKGTVQELEPLSDGSAIKLTVAHWVLPSGQILNHDGLQPTYVVPITDAEVAAGQDPQLTQALQVVGDEIAGTPLPPASTSTTSTATSTNQ